MCALRKGGFLSDPSTQPVLNRATVLAVDDEGLVRLKLADALRDQGYSVVGAGSGDQAGSSLRGGVLGDLVFSGVLVDLVLTDVRMPGSIDGLALAQPINSEFPEIKVIIASGHISSAPVGLADGLFSKPYDPAAVAGKIEIVLKAQAGALNRGRSGEVRSAEERPFEFAAE
jgi:CheY-like chemotaxis protein